MLYVFTGNGEGKTSAALGKALRALGYGNSVVVIQFMKKGESGEYMMQGRIEDFEIYQFGSGRFVDSADAREKRLAKDGLEFAKKIAREKKPDVLILDELNVAVAKKLIDKKDVINFIKNFKNGLLIITGRDADKEIIKLADVATEMREIKHHFKKGVKAKKGVNY